VTSDGKPVVFDVIVPSLPGFTFSSPPPENWTIDDTARIFNTLMTDVLGYSTYATHGTDWGCGVAYSLYSNFNSSVKAGHFSFLPFFPLKPDALAAQNITLSALEELEEQNYINWDATGNGYFAEQSTKACVPRVPHSFRLTHFTSLTLSALLFMTTQLVSLLGLERKS
jgi:hypothetical protein